MAGVVGVAEMAVGVSWVGDTLGYVLSAGLEVAVGATVLADCFEDLCECGGAGWCVAAELAGASCMAVPLFLEVDDFILFVNKVLRVLRLVE